MATSMHNQPKSFRFPPDLMKLSYYFCDEVGSQFHIVFECNSDEKKQRKGHLKWPLETNNHPFYPDVLYNHRDRYEGEVDDNYQMHGRG